MKYRYHTNTKNTTLICISPEAHSPYHPPGLGTIRPQWDTTAREEPGSLLLLHARQTEFSS